MIRFLAVLFVILFVFLGIFLLFLISPIPRSAAEALFLKTFPETGFFKIREMELLPWRPLSFGGLELQITKDPDGGYLKAENIRFRMNPFHLFTKDKRGVFEAEGVSFVSFQTELERLDCRVPIGLAPSALGKETPGFLQAARLKLSSLVLKNIKIDLSETAGLYQGHLEGEILGGRVSGNLRYEFSSDGRFEGEIDLKNLNLEEASREIGGFFERSQGLCQGKIKIKGEKGRILTLDGEVTCPKPGGKFQSQFLRQLGDWMPEGAAKQVFETEISSSDDFYFQEANLKIHNQKKGYLTFHLRLNNPKINLDIPFDISEQSFATLLKNSGVQRLLKMMTDKK